MGRVEPIRDEHALIAVKKILKQMSLREWALFAFGINAALRISDLLGLRVGDVIGSDGSVRDELDCTIAKTGRHLRVHLPPNAQDALRQYLSRRGLSLCFWACGSRNGLLSAGRQPRDKVPTGAGQTTRRARNP